MVSSQSVPCLYDDSDVATYTITTMIASCCFNFRVQGQLTATFTSCISYGTVYLNPIQFSSVQLLITVINLMVFIYVFVYLFFSQVSSCALSVSSSQTSRRNRIHARNSFESQKPFFLIYTLIFNTGYT